MSFQSDIKKFTDKAEISAEKVFRGSALTIFRAVILRTPVDTGRLRANWQCSLNIPSGGEIDGTDKTGSGAISAAASKTNDAKLSDSIYLVNNLPYAQAIEDGHSQEQAPAGMVKTTISEWNRVVAEKARQNK